MGRRLVMLAALALVLASCGANGATGPTKSAGGGVSSTGAKAAYTGVRTQGYPTPGKLTIITNERNGITLEVEGDAATVLALYKAAWEADDYSEGSRQQAGRTLQLVMYGHGGARTLSFTPVDRPGATVTSVHILTY